MIKQIAFLSLFTCLFFSVSAQKDVSSEAVEKIAEFKKTDDKINDIFGTAYGYAVFPSIGKGGIGVGGAYGTGTLFRSGQETADVRLTQVSVGFQFGGQKYSEIIFFENQAAYDRFIEGNFEFAAQVSAVALESGVSENAKYRDGVLVFTQAEGGLMYEASIGGQKFKVKRR